MKTWPSEKLGDLVQSLQPGFAARPEAEGEGVPHLRPLNMTEEGTLSLEPVKRVLPESASIWRYSLQDGDVLFNNTNSPELVGKVAVFRGEGTYAFSNHLTRVRVKRERLLPEFLQKYLFALWQDGFFKQQCTQWINQAAFNVDALSELPVPIPPLAEQERIVQILNEAEALRCLRTRADEQTNDLLVSTFHGMFDLQNYRRIPLGELTAMVTSGVTPLGGDEVYLTEGPYFIRSQNVQMNHLDLSSAACLPENIHRQMRRTRVLSGDVLLNITGASIGRVAWVNGLDREANVSQHVCLIRPKPDALDSIFLSVFISLPTVQHFILQVQAGASRQALNHQQVRALEIPAPPIQLQRTFAAQIAEIRELQAAQTVCRKRLDDLFQSLLHDAFQGEL